MAAARTIGVVGAGTMGSGIAQLAARSGARTLLQDPLAEALEQGVQRARGGLEKEAAKGKLSESEAQAAGARIEPTAELGAFAECELVIEAAPERLELKHELFSRLEEIVGTECVLASNTSSLPITAIAASVSSPERVVGMHFFNPAPLMALLEIISGVLSDERSLAVAQETGRAMGKQTIRASDGPGFLVNRCNRPFGLEALRLLGQGIADVETIDRIVRMGGGFKMGPFELSDLVGVDTGLAVSESFYELSFGEPRWRPSAIQAQRVAAGLYGRKSGRGYYDYGVDPHRPEDPAPPASERGEGVVAILGETPLAHELRDAAGAAGYEVSTRQANPGELTGLTVQCDPPRSGLGGAHPASEAPRRTGAPAEALAARRVGAPAAGRPGRPEALHPPPPEQLYSPRMLLCGAGSLAALDPDGDAVGFHVFSPIARAGVVELTRGERSSPAAVARAERFFAALGMHTVWVGDAPGLVLGRIVCQVINESAFALGEGVGSAKDIDTGMKLGLAHPRGPLEWADEIGIDAVLATLDGLWSEYREERYRAAPALRSLVRSGRIGRKVGAGFFDYPEAS